MSQQNLAYEKIIAYEKFHHVKFGKCKSCNGTGLSDYIETLLGNLGTERYCSECKGTGRAGSDTCRLVYICDKCKGTGEKEFKGVWNGSGATAIIPLSGFVTNSPAVVATQQPKKSKPGSQLNHLGFSSSTCSSWASTGMAFGGYNNNCDRCDGVGVIDWARKATGRGK